MPEFRVTTDDGVEVQEHTLTADDEGHAAVLGRGLRRAHVTRVELVREGDADMVPANPDAPEGEQFPDPEDPDTEKQKRLWPIFGSKEPST